MAQHNELGSEGEALAREYLKANGYTIIASNWRYLKAEIDIIAQKEEVLAIVEVKTRSSLNMGSPESFVSKKKINLLVSAAHQYVEKNQLDCIVRFDVISIYKNNTNLKISHIKEAFLFF